MLVLVGTVKGVSSQRVGRAESRAETKLRLLAAAAEVFAQRGFAAATLDEIAEKAGHTKGAVYYNFTDKEGLFLALLDQRVEANLQAVAASLDPQKQGSAQDTALNTTIEQARARDPQWCLLMTEFWLYAMRNPPVHARLTEHQHRLHNLVADLFQQQCAQHGITPAVPLPDLAALLLAADTGLAQMGLTDPALVPAGLYGHLVQLLRHAATCGWDEHRNNPTPLTN